MLCFQDKTFCIAQCKNLDCGRNIKHIEDNGKDFDKFERWSIQFEDGGPVAMADFSDNCPVYESG